MTTNAPRPSRPVRPIGRVRIGTPMLLGIVLAVTVPVTFAYGAAGGLARFRDHQLPGVLAQTGPVTAVEITGFNGDVHIDGDATARGVSGTWLVDYHEAATEPQPTETVVDGVAKLGWSCPADHCSGGVAWHLTVPAGVKVTVVTSDGSIFLGSVTGPVSATTSNAGIDATHLGSGDVAFRTSNGGVNARFDGAPMSVSVNTSNAGVEIWTDDKTDAFDDVQTSNAGTDLSNPGYNSRTATRTITVRTSNGGVTIH